jgi:hypothetical protein
MRRVDFCLFTKPSTDCKCYTWSVDLPEHGEKPSGKARIIICSPFSNIIIFILPFKCFC